MQNLIFVYLGVIAAVVFALRLRQMSSSQQACYAAIALVIAAFIYVAFGLWSPLPLQWLWEIAGLVLFAVLAWLGWRYHPGFLALGWIGHAAWDMALHMPPASGYAPYFYPPLCLGFDLILGGYLLSLRHRP